jgi:hypothetical protein
MNSPSLLRAAALFAGLLGWYRRLLAQTPALNPPAARISDRAIHADYQTYEQAQARIKALNDGGRPLRDYHLAKAQCWLDASFHEYSRNDRSAFPQQALDQSLNLVLLMEQKAASLPMDTPLVNEADRLRPDLWAQADTLKAHAGRACVAQRVACAEVALVHAGNEHRQQGWRHARPYVQMAEDQLQQAAAQVEAPRVSMKYTMRASLWAYGGVGLGLVHAGAQPPIERAQRRVAVRQLIAAIFRAWRTRLAERLVPGLTAPCPR